MRKAFNEMRHRWEQISETRQGMAHDLAECSFASTPLVTHGAWRGHTFASAAMHQYIRSAVGPFLEDVASTLMLCQQNKMRSRGRKSRRTLYIVNSI
jgi:hypothetical protein